MVHEIYYNPCPPNGGILCTASESYDHILYPHYHSVYELTIVVSGIHRLELENETLLLGAGDLVLLRPNETHARCLESPGKYITLAFPAGEFREVMKFLGSGASMRMFWQKHPPRTLLCRTEVDMIIPRIEYLNLLCASRPESTRMELRALLVMLCTYYFSNPVSAAPNSIPWLSKLLREMNKSENIRRGLPAMLDLVPYTHEYLCREFKRMLHCTPTEYINNARLNLARKLLNDHDRDIVDICYSVGFDSISYFYRLFKQKFGTTPSRYRKVRYISRPDVPPEQLIARADSDSGNKMSKKLREA